MEESTPKKKALKTSAAIVISYTVFSSLGAADSGDVGGFIASKVIIGVCSLPIVFLVAWWWYTRKPPTGEGNDW